MGKHTFYGLGWATMGLEIPRAQGRCFQFIFRTT